MSHTVRDTEYRKKKEHNHKKDVIQRQREKELGNEEIDYDPLFSKEELEDIDSQEEYLSLPK